MCALTHERNSGEHGVTQQRAEHDVKAVPLIAHDSGFALFSSRTPFVSSSHSRALAPRLVLTVSALSQDGKYEIVRVDELIDEMLRWLSASDLGSVCRAARITCCFGRSHEISTSRIALRALAADFRSASVSHPILVLPLNAALVFAPSRCSERQTDEH